MVAPVEEARVEVRGPGPESLEAIRAELRPAREVVHLLVLDLAREELGRIGPGRTTLRDPPQDGPCCC